MSLLTEKLRNRLPRIGNDPGTPIRDTTVHARFYDPSSVWNWYVIEYDGRETFFGLIVTRHTAVAGQFSLGELEAIVYDDPAEGEIRVRNDPNFTPVTVAKLAETDTNVMEFLTDIPPRELNAERDLVNLEGLDGPDSLL